MRIVVLADIHGNRDALDAVLTAAGPYDAVWFLGDVVGYGPDPGWCVDRIAALSPAVWLAGNHDLAAIGRMDLADFNTIARAAGVWTASQLTLSHVALLQSLPSKARIGDVTVAHGSPLGAEWEYVADRRTAERNLAAMATDLCFVGHTHMAAISELLASGAVSHRKWTTGETITVAQRKLIINPGSVGQPRDGDPRASYAVLDGSRDTVRLHRVTYDFCAVQAKIRRAGLPDILARRLAEGR